MPFSLKCLTRRSRSDAAMPAIYASIPVLFFLNSNRNAGPHPPIAATFAACLLVVAAVFLASFVRRRRCTVA